jgi:hypothetical protein
MVRRAAELRGYMARSNLAPSERAALSRPSAGQRSEPRVSEPTRGLDVGPAFIGTTRECAVPRGSTAATADGSGRLRFGAAACRADDVQVRNPRVLPFDESECGVGPDWLLVDASLSSFALAIAASAETPAVMGMRRSAGRWTGGTGRRRQRRTGRRGGVAFALSEPQFAVPPRRHPRARPRPPQAVPVDCVRAGPAHPERVLAVAGIPSIVPSMFICRGHS